MQRLQKVLAHCGVGSRRECEEIIEQGRVEVNGHVVTRLGTKVNPDDGIRVDGERVALERRVYYLLHKPRGYVCTNRDERGRTRVIDLIPDERRIYTVGRLDETSEGLVLLTNDGALTNIICHPRYQVDKTYVLEVRGQIAPPQLDQIERGVWLAEGKSAPAQVRRVDRRGDRSIITLSVWEGRNRELRRIFAKVALRVTRLTRTAIGPLRIDGLDVGAYRRADPRELAFARERMSGDWTPQPVAPPEGRRWEERLGRPRGPRRSR
ncbi:MAG: pseudouridine synthase [Planctomycetota bacterium]